MTGEPLTPKAGAVTAGGRSPAPDGLPTSVSLLVSGGARVVAHVLGGSGPPLLLAHATGFHGRVWRPVAERLASAFSCVAPDARGHGDSPPPASGQLRWSDFAGDLLAVMDGLGLTRPLGVGHSSGATALLLAEQARPGTFAQLYCFEPIVVPADPPLGRDPDSWLAEQARRRRTTFASRAEALDHYAGRRPLSRLDPAVLRAYVEHGLEDADDGAVRLKCVPDYEALVYEMATEHDCFVRLANVHCPVILVRGAHSDACPPGLFETLAGRLPRSRSEVLPGVSHLGPLEDPAAVARSIAQAFAPPQP